VEQNASKKYIGSIVVDDLTVEYLKRVDLPVDQPVSEPILSNWDSLTPNVPKFAVVSGINLMDNSDTLELSTREQLLWQLTTENIDFIIFNGGIVSADTPDNYRFAKDYLNVRLGLPYYAVPGKQDISGTGNLNSFIETFGSDFQMFDTNSTRFILLNSSLGNLRVSNPSQWQAVIQWLKDSKTNSAINNIVIVSQSPLNIAYTLPANGSDSYEVKLLEELLTQVVEESGKNVSYISSASKEPTVKHYNGVSYIDTGCSLTPDYSLFGINHTIDGKPSIVVKFTP
jgi:3',5'-cyclic AMP phosphodiesterase CpdA